MDQEQSVEHPQQEQYTVVLDRFDKARRSGATAKTAVIVAAWAWRDYHPDREIHQAVNDVRQFLARSGRRA